VWPSWDALERKLPELGEPFFFSSHGSRSFWDVRYPDDVALVFGRESVGLSADILARYQTRTLRVPMIEPKLRSVNLSTTAGVAMFEVMRQRTRAEPFEGPHRNRLPGYDASDDATGDSGTSNGAVGRCTTR
jgi:tRNA(Leu) C34 or U34 (ribose-2'-O)-methylase TrmL